MTLISSRRPSAMSAAFWRSISAALARSSRSFDKRQLGLLGPALLKLVEAGQRAAHFLAVGDAARGRGADLDQGLLHLEDDHSDHLRRIFRPVEHLGDVRREDVPRSGKDTHSVTPNSKIRALNLPITYTRAVPDFRKGQSSVKFCNFPPRKRVENPCQMVGFATNSRSDSMRAGARTNSSAKAWPSSTRSSGRAAPRRSTGRCW